MVSSHFGITEMQNITTKKVGNVILTKNYFMTGK